MMTHNVLRSTKLVPFVSHKEDKGNRILISGRTFSIISLGAEERSGQTKLGHFMISMEMRRMEGYLSDSPTGKIQVSPS